MNDLRDKTKGAIDTGASQAKQGVDKAANAGRDAKNTAGGMMDTVKEGAQQAAGAVAEYAGTAKDKVQEWGQDAAKAVGPAADKVGQWAHEAYDVTADSLQDFSQETTRMIRKYPLTSLMIGFGAGLLIGRLMRVV